MLGKVMALHSKLAKHVADNNPERVRDYLVVMAHIWPNMNECPIDHKLLKKAASVLREAGYTISIEDRKGVVITGPNGKSYASYGIRLDPELEELCEWKKT